MAKRGKLMPMKPKAGAVSKVAMLTALAIGLRNTASSRPRIWHARMNRIPAASRIPSCPRNGNSRMPNRTESAAPSTIRKRIV